MHVRLIMAVKNCRTMEFTLHGGESKMFDTIGAKVTQVRFYSRHAHDLPIHIRERAAQKAIGLYDT